MKKKILTTVLLFLLCAALLAGCGDVLEKTAGPAESTASASSAVPETAAEEVGSANLSGSTDLPHETETPKKETQTPTPVPKKTVTPTPEPTPEAPRGEPDINLIRERVEELAGSYDGEWSVFFKRLDTHESFCLNDKAMVAASLIKLFVYGTAREQIEQGLLPEGDYDGYLWDMIAYSDNDSCNILIDAAGGLEAVNEFIARNDFPATQINRRMLDWNGSENYTSVSDCGRLLELTLDQTYVSNETSQSLQNAMMNGTNTWKIPAGIPEGIVTGNKTGELDRVENDAAFILSPACTYILCVMTADVDAGTAHANIAELSAAVYSLLNG